MNVTYEEKLEFFNKISNHLLEDDSIIEFFIAHINTLIFKEYPFSMIRMLQETEQSKVYHKEGNALTHTLLVVNEASKIKYLSKNPLVFMWSALLHDIGKPNTTRIRKGRITSYDHDKVGAELAREFLAYFGCFESFIFAVEKMVRYHMHLLYIQKNLPFAKLDDMKREVNVYELALLGYCDKMGRKGSDKEKERRNIEEFLKKVLGLDATMISFPSRKDD